MSNIGNVSRPSIRSYGSLLFRVVVILIVGAIAGTIAAYLRWIVSGLTADFFGMFPMYIIGNIALLFMLQLVAERHRFDAWGRYADSLETTLGRAAVVPDTHIARVEDGGGKRHAPKNPNVFFVVSGDKGNTWRIAFVELSGDAAVFYIEDVVVKCVHWKWWQVVVDSKTSYLAIKVSANVSYDRYELAFDGELTPGMVIRLGEVVLVPFYDALLAAEVRSRLSFDRHYLADLGKEHGQVEGNHMPTTPPPGPVTTNPGV